jgi:sugar phosphate isomerase/epimerase
MTNLRFGVDLITFFDPDFWGVENAQAIGERARADPRAFWDRILDELAQSQTRGIELTFAPFDWRGTIAAYGSAERFAAELAKRDLHLATGFFVNVAIGGDITDPAVQDAHVADALAYADYLAAVGATVMVVGLPMRRSWDDTPPLFVDLALASTIADFCNRLGAAVLRHGIRLALHNEAHSVFCTARDIDLFLLLTDPVYVGFCPDTAHMVLSGADPITVVDRHRDRLLATHWKDATGPAPERQPIDADIHKSHRAFFCALGSGCVDWPAWMRLMRDIGFTGPAILEIDAVRDPRAAMEQSMNFVSTSLLPIYR